MKTLTCFSIFIDILQGLFIIFGGSIGLYLHYRRTEAVEVKNDIFLKVAEDQVFVDTIKLLKEDTLHSQIGGIIGLDKIARHSKDYHPSIMKLFCTYIRERSFLELEAGTLKNNGNGASINEALSSIRTRKIEHDSNSPMFDFNNSILDHCDFKSIKLKNGIFTESMLTHCDFDSAVLENCDFREAKLFGTSFSRCVFINPSFAWADLKKVSFKDSTMTLEVSVFRSFFRSKLAGTDFSNLNIKEKIGQICFIRNVTNAVIVFEDMPLCNKSSFFEESYKDGQIQKSESEKVYADIRYEKTSSEKAFQELGGSFDIEFSGGLDTRFPDWVKVIPKGENGFKLELIEEVQKGSK